MSPQKTPRPPPDIDDTWQRIAGRIRQLTRRDHGEAAWLCAKTGMKIQRVVNWKTRGVPSAALPDIAAALGWSINQVLGISDPPGQWPFESIERDRIDRLNPRQFALVELAARTELERIEQASKTGPLAA